MTPKTTGVYQIREFAELAGVTVRAQALAARRKELVAGFTGGDPDVQKGLNKMWADQPHWPVAQRSQFGIKPEIQAFIVSAFKAEA